MDRDHYYIPLQQLCPHPTPSHPRLARGGNRWVRRDEQRPLLYPLSTVFPLAGEGGRWGSMDEQRPLPISLQQPCPLAGEGDGWGGWIQRYHYSYLPSRALPLDRERGRLVRWMDNDYYYTPLPFKSLASCRGRGWIG